MKKNKKESYNYINDNIDLSNTLSSRIRLEIRKDVIMEKVNKKILGIITLTLLCTVIVINTKTQEEVQDKISINGDSFALLLDDKEITTIPNAGTYLVDYVCDNNSKITWDRETGQLSLSKNTKTKENCTLIFKTNPLVSELPQGSYVAYEGSNGCLKGGTATATITTSGQTLYENNNSCLGYNANANSDGSKDSTNGMYGYCSEPNYKYYVSGWRIAYVDLGRAYIISAGSPECTTRRNSTNGNEDYISDANLDAKKYCNENFVDDCTSDTDAHAINDTDYNKITAQATGTTGGYMYTAITGASRCGATASKEVCGYNNDLLDIGGNYWFAAANSTTSTNGVRWRPHRRDVLVGSETNAYGLRPVIRLSENVYVTDGSGTPEDPYQISNVSQ